MADGWITIGTKLDTTKFDQEVSNLEKKIDSAEKKQDLINQKTQQYKDELAQVSNQVDDLSQQYEKAVQEAERLRQTMNKQGTGSYQGFQASLDYDNQVKKVDELYSQLSKAEGKQQTLTNKISQSNLQYENSVKQVDSLRGKLQLLDVKKAQSSFGGLNNNIDNMQRGITNSISKIGKLALGVFSVASAFAIVSRASSTLAQYDDQYAANLEYIQFALAQGIAPILKGLVNLAAQLLGYLNYILNAWFGINLFANAGASDFAKMANSASNTAKSAKEIKNQLAGFDEMNVVGNSGTDSLGGSTGGAGGTVAPSIDLSGIQGEVPSWIKWIAENKDIVIAALAGIAAGIKALTSGLGLLKSLGIAAIVGGIVYTVESLLDYLKDPSWENFGKIIQGIGIVIIGLGATFLGLPAVIAGVIVLIVGTIVKYWEQIKSFFQNGIDWLKGLGGFMTDIFGETFGGIYNHIVDALQQVLNFFDSIFTAIKGVFDGIIEFVKGVFTGNWQQAWDGIKQIFSSIWEGLKGIVKSAIVFIVDIITALGLTIKGIVESLWNGIVSILSTVGTWIYNNVISPVAEFFSNMWQKIKEGASNAWEGIKSVFSTVAEFFKNIFTNAWTAVKNVFSVGGQIFDGIKDGIVSAFKTIVNAIINGINKVVAVPFNAINSVLDKIRSVSIAGIKPFTWVGKISVPKIPTLATGGIINYPNHGVMLGSAIAGEAGAEGVIPLTDSQAMETLGKAIGRYITINANITNTMNGRVISRQMKKIQLDKDFAYNT